MIICDDCKQLLTCHKFCMMHIGYAMALLLSNIDFIDTNIGDKEYIDYFKETYVTCGVSYAETTEEFRQNGDKSKFSIGDIRSAVSKTPLDASDKLLTVNNASAYKMMADTLNKYFKTNADSERAINSLIKIGKDFKDNRKVVTFIKPGDFINIKGLGNFKVARIQWNTSHEDYKLRCEISVFDKDTNSYINVNLEDYGIKYRKSDIFDAEPSTKYDRELIRMTQFGLFRPIEVYDSRTIIAVDNVYMYGIVDDSIAILGEWKGNKIIPYKKLSGNCYKRVMRNEALLAEYRKYMIPYKLAEPVRISTKEAIGGQD